MKNGCNCIGLLDIKAKDQIRRVHSTDAIAPSLTTCGGGQREVKIFDTSKLRIRKLTPKEYGRLQGFPDSYEIVVSDSQAYKQFGNAVTVTLFSAIADSIKNHILESEELFMSMEILKSAVEKEVEAELNRSLEKWPLFNSRHEGISAIREELEETQEELAGLEYYIDLIWSKIKDNECDMDKASEAAETAIKVACEAIQTAAMLLKYNMSVSDT